MIRTYKYKVSTKSTGPHVGDGLVEQRAGRASTFDANLSLVTGTL